MAAKAKLATLEEFDKQIGIDADTAAEFSVMVAEARDRSCGLDDNTAASFSELVAQASSSSKQEQFEEEKSQSENEEKEQKEAQSSDENKEQEQFEEEEKNPVEKKEQQSKKGEEKWSQIDLREVKQEIEDEQLRSRMKRYGLEDVMEHEEEKAAPEESVQPPEKIRKLLPGGVSFDPYWTDPWD